MRANGRLREPELAFDVQEFLGTAGLSRRIAKYRRGQTIFRQGDEADTVLYVQSGSVGALAAMKRTSAKGR